MCLLCFQESWFFDENEDILDFEEPEPESDDYYADTAKPKRRRRIVAPVKAPKVSKKVKLQIFFENLIFRQNKRVKKPIYSTHRFQIL